MLSFLGSTRFLLLGRVSSGISLHSSSYRSASLRCCIEMYGIRGFQSRRTFHHSSVHAKGFIGKFVENIKQEIAKNKEMKDNLRKFREEAEKLEHTDALKKARQKYQSVESEASKSSEALKGKIGQIRGKVQEVLDEASKSDIAKKAGQIKEEISKTARGAAESISESGSKISQTGAFQSLSNTAQTVKKEIDQAALGSRVYKPPAQLRKRVDTASGSEDQQHQNVSPNDEATGIELHKDSKFFQSWQNFKENNPYVMKVMDWKIRYDESDNPMIRASRFVTDKVTDVFGGLFQKTELSETLTEICRIDPEFDKGRFLKQCEEDIIPNILEAIVRGDLEVLRDWCYEATYSVISTPISEVRKRGYRLNSKVLDIDKVDLVMGKIMEQGPVLVISFQAQQIMSIVDDKAGGKIIEGDPNKVLRVNYVWVLCRDPNEINPNAAWRLLEMSASSSEQLL